MQLTLLLLVSIILCSPSLILARRHQRSSRFLGGLADPFYDPYYGYPYFAGYNGFPYGPYYNYYRPGLLGGVLGDLAKRHEYPEDGHWEGESVDPFPPPNHPSPPPYPYPHHGPSHHYPSAGYPYSPSGHHAPYHPSGGFNPTIRPPPNNPFPSGYGGKRAERSPFFPTPNHVLVPQGSFVQTATNPGYIIVNEEGKVQQLIFSGLGSPNSCTIGTIIDPLWYHGTTGLIEVTFQELVIKGLVLNSATLESVTAETAVLHAVVQVGPTTTTITGTIKIRLDETIVPHLVAGGLENVLNASLDLVIPINLVLIQEHEIVPDIGCL